MKQTKPTEETKIKTRSYYVDIDTGVTINWSKAKQFYQKLKVNKNAYRQNGWTILEYRTECKRIVEKDLFGETGE